MSRTRLTIKPRLSCLTFFLLYSSLTPAATCTQSVMDGTNAPKTTNMIYPRVPLVPFYQWGNNYGYCGEVDLLQAGMNNGQWMSQYNARRICGPVLDSIPSGRTMPEIIPNNPPTPYPLPLPWTIGMSLSQAGPEPWCKIFKSNPNLNAQLSFEDPLPNIHSGPNDFGHASLCLANARLQFENYNYADQPDGQKGFQEFMSWIKAQVIAGNQVGIGIIERYGSDSEYDHDVSVIKIGTNHSVTDPTYYPDDVLYIDDHGVYGYDLQKKEISGIDPSIPLGVNDKNTCTPYIYGYRFDQWGQTRDDANKNNAHLYSIIIPGSRGRTWQGNDGFRSTTKVMGRNYGFAVSGPADDNNDTLPVTVSIVSSSTDGVANPKDPIAGFNYENPMIADGLPGHLGGDACSNAQPKAMSITLAVKVSGLIVGNSYNLYEYDFDGISGVQSDAGLDVPTSNFNAKASKSTNVTQFTATATEYTKQINTTSDKIVVFRAVASNAP